ncbi:MAG: Ldh family oxidoreductase, partial [Chloroflexi bacterium]|nr:Ldh family oxidoreductase [Chloroflexota bacterium]
PLGSYPDASSYKGYGLAIVVDILCGVLSGMGASPGLGRNFGHFFGALRIDAFRPADQFKTMMDEMGADLRATPTLPGYERVLVPGDKEAQAKEERLKEGIPLHPPVAESLLALGRELGVPLEF